MTAWVPCDRDRASRARRDAASRDRHAGPTSRRGLAEEVGCAGEGFWWAEFGTEAQLGVQYLFFISYFLFSLFKFNLNSDLIQTFWPFLTILYCAIKVLTLKILIFMYIFSINSILFPFLFYILMVLFSSQTLNSMDPLICY
jgi:hypothetical protein